MEYKEYQLGELLSYVQPTPYIVKSTDYDDSYKIPVLTPGKTFILGFTDEDFGIFNRLPVIIFDDFTTASRYVDFEFKVKSSAMKILIPNTDLVNPKYIFYRMQIIQFDHSTHKRYWIQHYSKIKVAIPNLEEQTRVVSIIEELLSQVNDSVNSLNIAKKKLDVYRNAVLRDAFEGKLTENHLKVDVNLDFVEGSETKELPEIPKEWQYVPLAQLGDLGRGKSKHRPRNDPKLFENGIYPFIQTAEVGSANKFITNYSMQYGEFGLSQSKLWPAGTLCITIAANIAETAFLGIDACFPDSVVGFTPNEYTSAEYIKYFIESQKVRLWAYAPATAQKNINLKTLENLIVPYCRYEEQLLVVKSIEERISVCDSIENTVDTVLQQSVGLEQSILKKAFEGRL